MLWSWSWPAWSCSCKPRLHNCNYVFGHSAVANTRSKLTIDCMRHTRGLNHRAHVAIPHLLFPKISAKLAGNYDRREAKKQPVLLLPGRPYFNSINILGARKHGKPFARSLAQLIITFVLTSTDEAHALKITPFKLQSERIYQQMLRYKYIYIYIVYPCVYIDKNNKVMRQARAWVLGLPRRGIFNCIKWSMTTFIPKPSNPSFPFSGAPADK